MPNEASDGKSDIDEFLIAEYQHFADSFWRTEELGEKRLNFFISLLTAAVAGLVLLATNESGFSDEEVRWTAFSTGLALLFLGVSTLLRMLRRNDVADEYKRAIGLIRKSFATRYGLVGYDPFGAEPPAPQPLPRKLFRGGLAETAALQRHDRGRAHGDRPLLGDIGGVDRACRGGSLSGDCRRPVSLHPRAE